MYEVCAQRMSTLVKKNLACVRLKDRNLSETDQSKSKSSSLRGWFKATPTNVMPPASVVASFYNPTNKALIEISFIGLDSKTKWKWETTWWEEQPVQGMTVVDLRSHQPLPST
jgi:hypothetical protein